VFEKDVGKAVGILQEPKAVELLEYLRVQEIRRTGNVKKLHPK